MYTVSDLPTNMQNKIVDDGHCWRWTGAKNPKGYGSTSKGAGGGTMLAHRKAYMRAVGAIPEGFEIDHLCENTSCVNPAHLEAVTRQEHQRRIGHRDLAPTYAPESRGPDLEISRIARAFITRIEESRMRYAAMSDDERASHDAGRHRLHIATGSRCACEVA